MLRRANWIARGLGYAVDGVLTFLHPPAAHSATVAQVVAYALLGVALLGWSALSDRLGANPGDDPRLAVVLGVLAAAAGFGAGAGGLGVVLVAFALVAALAAGSDCSLGQSLAVLAASILAVEVSGLLYGGDYGIFLGLPLPPFAGFMFGRNRGVYRLQARDSAALLAQREQLEAQQRRADLLDERARIAREIHDILAHSLGALGIQIQAARAVLTDRGDVRQAEQLLAGAQLLANEGLVETRRAIHALRTDPPPLAEELAQLSDTHAQRYRVRVDFDTSGETAALPPEASLALLRVTQEALVNAAKHAPGQAVAIRLEHGPREVRLTVHNALADSMPAEGEAEAGLHTADSGYGLSGMRERLRLLDGGLDAGPRQAEWVVAARLPLRGASVGRDDASPRPAAATEQSEAHR